MTNPWEVERAKEFCEHVRAHFANPRVSLLVAETIRNSDGCGMSLRGTDEFVFCDDKRLGEDACRECGCKQAAAAVVAAIQDEIFPPRLVCEGGCCRTCGAPANYNPRQLADGEWACDDCILK